jgi:RimJ/RimL family protein N-acetyltransferase
MNKVQKETVHLCFFRPEHEQDLLSFQLSEEQGKFTSLPGPALQLCMEEAGRHPIVILAGDTAAGFFVLHTGEGIRYFTENTRAILMRALSINPVFQGRGYGKQAMLQVFNFAKEHFPEHDEIVLAVNVNNVAAKTLYEKTGFEDSGELKEGPVGYQHVLHLPLF